MIRPSTVSQFVRVFVTAAALAVGAMGCGSGGDSTGSAGSGGGGGTGGSTAACSMADVTAIFTSTTKNVGCTIIGACHDNNGAAAGLDLTTAGWETHLVGKVSAGGGTGSLASMCGGMVYLKAGVVPAQGLFIDKLTKNPPPCGAPMPNLPPLLTATQKACVQSWADNLVMNTH